MWKIRTVVAGPAQHGGPEIPNGLDGVFATIALLLTIIGLYKVISYS